MSIAQVAEAVTAKAGTSRLRHLGPELRLVEGQDRWRHPCYRWTWPNGWSPAPERWFHSPEAALEPWT